MQKSVVVTAASSFRCFIRFLLFFAFGPSHLFQVVGALRDFAPRLLVYEVQISRDSRRAIGRLHHPSMSSAVENVPEFNPTGKLLRAVHNSVCKCGDCLLWFTQICIVNKQYFLSGLFPNAVLPLHTMVFFCVFIFLLLEEQIIRRKGANPQPHLR